MTFVQRGIWPSTTDGLGLYGSGGTETRPAVSIVAPCYNEAEVLPEFHQRASVAAQSVSGEAYEIVQVDDGSSDGTWPTAAPHRLPFEFSGLGPCLRAEVWAAIRDVRAGEPADAMAAP